LFGLVSEPERKARSCWDLQADCRPDNIEASALHEQADVPATQEKNRTGPPGPRLQLDDLRKSVLPSLENRQLGPSGP
jgi:hypothetical protein